MMLPPRIPAVLLPRAHIMGFAQTIKMEKLADSFFTDTNTISRQGARPTKVPYMHVSLVNASNMLFHQNSKYAAISENTKIH